jgi:hypothetical protein
VKCAECAHIYDNLIDSVNKLGREVSLDSTHNKISCCRLDRTFTDIVEISRAKIACHYYHSVLKIDHAALAVSETTIVQYLEEECDKLAACLLDPNSPSLSGLKTKKNKLTRR